MNIERLTIKSISIDKVTWHECRVRKAHDCSDCLKKKPKGSKMYRPADNAPFRDERLCLDCIKKLEAPLSLDTPIDKL